MMSEFCMLSMFMSHTPPQINRNYVPKQNQMIEQSIGDASRFVWEGEVDLYI